MTPSFVIEHPTGRLNNTKSVFAKNFRYQRAFYDLLFEVLKEENIPYRTVPFGRSDAPLKPFNDDEIYFAYHKKEINVPHAYTIKEAYTLHELYLDKTGYSGWAEIANNRDLFEESQSVDLDEAKRFLEPYVDKYRSKSLTKYAQPPGSPSLPSKYVLVILQVGNDTVNELADISSYDLGNIVSKAYAGNMPVLIKPHPRDHKFRASGIRSKNGRVVRASLEHLIPKARAVYTVNSGVGFESLLYGKPVFTSGHNDYHWVTTRVRNAKDVVRTKGMFDIDRDRIAKYLYFFLDKYVITFNDKEQIRSRIRKMVKDF